MWLMPSSSFWSPAYSVIVPGPFNSTVCFYYKTTKKEYRTSKPRRRTVRRTAQAIYLPRAFLLLFMVVPLTDRGTHSFRSILPHYHNHNLPLTTFLLTLIVQLLDVTNLLHTYFIETSASFLIPSLQYLTHAYR